MAYFNAPTYKDCYPSLVTSRVFPIESKRKRLGSLNPGFYDKEKEARKDGGSRNRYDPRKKDVLTHFPANASNVLGGPCPQK